MITDGQNGGLEGDNPILVAVSICVVHSNPENHIKPFFVFRMVIYYAERAAAMREPPAFSHTWPSIGLKALLHGHLT